MSLPRIQTDDRKLEQLQTNVGSVLNPLLDNPLLQGHILKGILLTSGTNKVPHGLGRELVGWIVVRQFNSATLYDQQQNSPGGDGASFLTLVASALVAVDLYVF